MAPPFEAYEAVPNNDAVIPSVTFTEPVTIKLPDITPPYCILS